jgi:hypothetical protein
MSRLISSWSFPAPGLLMRRLPDRVGMGRILPVSVVIAVVVFGAVALNYMAVLVPPQGRSDTGGSATQTTSITQTVSAAPSSSVFQTTTSHLAVASTTMNFFNIEPQFHLLTITPQNHTFTFTYNVTTWYSAVTLTFDQSKSYAQVYTNGTVWESTSRPCSSNTIASTSVANSTSRTSVTITVDLRCGQPPNTGWNPVNGTLVNPQMEFTSSEIQVSLQPDSFAASYAGTLRVTVNLNLKPGVYYLILVLGVQTKPSAAISSWAQVPAIPIIVK